MYSSKRPRASPTGLTPTQRLKKRVQHSDSARRCRLFEQPSTSKSGSADVVGSTDPAVSIRAVEIVKNPTYSCLYPPSLSRGLSPSEDETQTQFMLLSTAGDTWTQHEVLGGCSCVPEEQCWN